MLCSRFFFHSFLFYFCRIVGVTRGTNVLPERLKFRILFREHLIWKSHLPSSLKIHNPSIFKILWTVNNAKVQIISRFEHNFPFKFTDNRISISDCILSGTDGENVRNAVRNTRDVVGFYYFGVNVFRKWLTDPISRKEQKRTVFFWRRLSLS